MDTREAVARAIDPAPWNRLDTGRGADHKPFRDSDPMRRAASLRKADAAIAAHLKALAAEGYVVVPREPTEAQMKLCYDWALGAREVAKNERFYRAMIQEVDNG